MLETVTVCNGRSVLRGRRGVTSARPLRGALRRYVTPPSTPGPMSRNKGKVGEREVAELLRAHGFPARRGVQY